ncbi:MAG: tetratricopeptide repeat protein [Sedimentisphaerales bacterium]|nr:tetratricopeptide repeat protein [Sedimentisphaerales bacterium]
MIVHFAAMPEPDAQPQMQAKACFERARQASEAGDFDRAIGAYIDGLRWWPDSVEGGHIELRVLALRRLERGGAKPAAEEIGRHLDQGDSALEKMLNAEYLLAKDPENLSYAEAVLRAAVAGPYPETVRWMADLMFLANNNAKKPAIPLYVTLKEAYEAVGQTERAFAACRRAAALAPEDETLISELKRLMAKLPPQKRAAARRTTPGSGGPVKTATKRVPAGTDDPAEPQEAAAPRDIDDPTPRRYRDPDLEEAKVFFEKAWKAAEAKNYDYAIEMYLDGLRRAPDALEEGHLPLVELGLQRRSLGGKKPTMVERVKRLRGKTPLEQMLNAEYLFTKDPDHLPYAEAMLRAAVEGGYTKTGHWIANLIFQTNNALEKPSLQTYVMLKDAYIELGQFDKAVAACQRAVRMKPDDKELADEFKNLSAELTMAKGKYTVEGDFRQSIRDRDTQARLYAQDRVVKTQDYRVTALEEARKAYAQDPDVPKHVFDLAEALADMQQDASENEAIQLLEDACAGHKDFRYKDRAGALRIKQIKRKIRLAKRQLETRPMDAQAKNALAELTDALNRVELEHYRLCMENYPTDLAAKYEYGLRLMRNKQYNKAIPLFQEAQKDPRRRIQAMDKVGYCFFMKGWYNDAVDVFSRAIESYEIKDDATANELRYNLARAYEEQNDKEKALELYRRIVQLDFGYRDVSDRVGQLRLAIQEDQAGGSAPGAV